ncbi:MAG: DUF2304 family protein [Anaerolineaceae bacterium]|nr:DUF2304 family protein [Anaerolineaceae bacterium]
MTTKQIIGKGVPNLLAVAMLGNTPGVDTSANPFYIIWSLSMVDRAMIFGLVAGIGAFIFVLELVRRRRLKEEYSLLWLATAVALIVLSLSRPALDLLASTVGIIYPPSALFLVAVIFVLFILLHYSIVLTRLTQENKENAQQLALLRWQIEQMQKALPASEINADERQNDQNSRVNRDKPVVLTQGVDVLAQ